MQVKTPAPRLPRADDYEDEASPLASALIGTVMQLTDHEPTIPKKRRSKFVCGFFKHGQQTA